MKNCKYTLDWQCERLILKSIKDINKKLIYAESVFNRYRDNSSDQALSVLNWLKGLSLAYKDKSKFEELYSKLESSLEGISLRAETLPSAEEIKEKDNLLLKRVLEDNLRRDIKWLSKYYIHKELNEFVDRVASVVGYSEAWYKKEQLLKECEGHTSEWSFIY